MKATNKSKHSFRLVADASEVTAALSRFNLYLSLIDLPLRFRKRLIKLIKLPSNLARIERGFAIGASVVITLKTTDFFSDLLAAMRAGEIEKFIIKNTHK